MATKESGSSTGAKKADQRKSADAESTTKKSTKKSPSSASAPRAAAPPKQSAKDVATSAARELQQLTGKQPESITGLERTDDGWLVQIEVVEVRRYPDTTDVLALYEVNASERGEMQSYRRVNRYVRTAPKGD